MFAYIISAIFVIVVIHYFSTIKELLKSIELHSSGVEEELADIKNELENLSTDLNEREPIDLSDVTNTLEDIKSHLESIEANTDKS